MTSRSNNNKKKTLIIANSDEIYAQSTPQGGRQSYFQGLIHHSNNNIQQRIAVGDLCAFTCPVGIRQEPFPEQPWMIGQVLTLYSITNPKQPRTYHATVRWMLRFDCEGKEFLTKADLADTKKNFRTDQALLESLQIQTLSLVDHLLPADIVVQHSSVFAVKDPLPDEPLFDNVVWKLLIHVPRRLGHDARVLQYGSDDSNVTLSEEWVLAMNSLEQQQPPPPLLRAWNAMQQQQESNGCSPALMKALQQTYGSVERQGPRFQLVSSGKENTTSTKSEKNKRKAAAPKTKSTKRPRKEAAVGARRSSRSNSGATAAPKTLRTRGRQTKTTRNQAVNEKRPLISTKRTTLSTRHQPKRQTSTRSQSTPETVMEDESSSEEEQDESSEEEEVDLRVRPTSDILYELEPRHQNKRKAETIYFVQGIELDLNRDLCHSSLRPRQASRWTVRVGDLIALSCQDATQPPRPMKKKSLWYPFTGPWSACQVIAVYRRGSSADYMMEVRWLYRAQELDNSVQLTKDERRELIEKGGSERMLVELDEHVTEVSVEAAIGRLALTSQAKPGSKFLNAFRSDDGVPQVPMICRYIHDSKNDATTLDRVDDWTDYSQSLAGPLSRGLLCPKGLPGKYKRVLRRYEAFVRSRFQLEGDLQGAQHELSPPPSPESSIITSWPEELLDTGQVRVDDNNRVLHRTQSADGIDREFFESVLVPVVNKRCDARATAKKSAKNVMWTLRVGDLVCIANNEAGRIGFQTNRNPWYPFVGPWSFCQVLNIYRDSEGKISSNVGPLLEVRWLHRKSDLPSHVHDWMPSLSDSKREEVYETDLVEIGIPSSRLLGPADIYLAHHTDMSNPRPFTEVDECIPKASCRCGYIYLSSVARFQPLFCSKTTPEQWFQRMLQQGFKLSPLIKKDPILGETIESTFCVQLGATATKSLFFALASAKEEATTSTQVPVLTRTCEDGATREYYVSTSLLPPWTTFAEADTICCESERRGLQWTVRVGDVVAVRAKESLPSQKSYPFTVPWRPCQVLSIYRDKNVEGKTDEEGRCLFQVRWFYRRAELPQLGETYFEQQSLEVCYETDDVLTSPIEPSELLGPIALIPGSDVTASKAIWQTIPPHLPYAGFIYSGFFSKEKEGLVVLSKDPCKDLRHIIKRGIDLSSHFDNEDKKKVLLMLRKGMQEPRRLASVNPLPMSDFVHENTEANLFSPQSKGSDNGASANTEDLKVATKVWASLPPFHTDPLTGNSYFTELDVVPPYSNYLTCEPPHEIGQTPVWKLKLGDTVAVHYEKCAGKAVYGWGAGGDTANKNYPMRVPWAVAEVVNVFKMQKTSAAVQEGGDDVGDSADDFKLEIRWVYRANEIPGSKVSSTDTEGLCEEIFETDVIDTISSSSLLAPVYLYSLPFPIGKAKMQMGMPIIEFCCKRFWSVHRKALIPCNGLSGRIERGRLLSAHMAKVMALKAALDRMGSCNAEAFLAESDKPNANTASWKEAFQKVIKKLSLTDASKEAYEDGSVLVGREKEREEITSFLKAALRGKGKDTKSSIFVAGPPGTGKTASVRAAVRELHHAQSKGSIPEFDFITLNGMEMRHPFEAYVKLWEELTGTKSKCTPETAAAKLEAYFTGEQVPDSQEVCHTAVVLLDEIDYLVTKQQSVLYNFFDWPTRASEVGSKRRLIVVGVSNTLNLPDRLHPRVQSRIGTRRCFFKSYNYKEIEAILHAKMKQASPDYEVFDRDAIVFASKKTAAMSGDIRKAFHICRAASEMIMHDVTSGSIERSKPTVLIKDVLKVSRESFNSATSRAVGLCTPFEALFLVALASLSKSTGRELGGFDVEEIMTKMDAMANAVGDPMYSPAPTLSETLGILTRLGEVHLVSLHTPQNASISYRASLAGSGGAWPLVSMVMDDVAVLLALKGTPHHQLAQKYLAMSSFG